MSTKKKVAISLIAVIGILLIVSVALVAVFGAANQNIKSNVKVNFKHSSHVIGYVSATYSYGNNVKVMTTDGKVENEDNKKVSFNYGENSTTKTLQMQSSDLTYGALQFAAEIKELILTFKFENKGNYDFTAYLDDSNISKKDNIKLSYGDENGNWSSELPTILVKSPLKSLKNSVKKYYIKIEVENSAKDAVFDGNLVWNLESEQING